MHVAPGPLRIELSAVLQADGVQQGAPGDTNLSRSCVCFPDDQLRETLRRRSSFLARRLCCIGNTSMLTTASGSVAHIDHGQGGEGPEVVDV